MNGPAVQHIAPHGDWYTTRRQVFREPLWHRAENVPIRCHDMLGFSALSVGRGLLLFLALLLFVLLGYGETGGSPEKCLNIVCHMVAVAMEG